MPKSHWIKIDRALEHIETLERSIAVWRDDDSYSTREEREPDSTDPTLVRVALCMRVSEPFPVAWSAYIGDAIHCLRASLDHMAFTLNSNGYAKAHNGADLPLSAAQESEFPIFGDTDRKGNAGKGADLFAKAITRKLRFASPDAVKLIEAIQPYQRGKESTLDPLWVIHELDIIDKHRKIVVSAASTTEIIIHKLVIAGPSRNIAIGKRGPFDDGDEIAAWTTTPELASHDDLEAVFHEAFGKETPIPGWPLIKSLRELHECVREVARQLDPHM